MPKIGSGLAAIEAKYVKGLKDRKARLVAELATIDERLRALGKPTTYVRRGRPRKRGCRSAPLRAFVTKALAKTSVPMRIREIEQAVLRAGYKTRAKGLYNAITAVLAQSREVRKAGRGRYAAKQPVKAKPKAKAKAKSA
ncbi:MAG: hypothetical protein V2A58_16965 [Planctomycetota bacterium]